MATDEQSHESSPTLIQIDPDVSKCSLCEFKIVVNRATEKSAKRSRAEQDRKHANLFAEHVRLCHPKADDSESA